MDEIIKHRNTWPFGNSTTIVLENGYGIVKVTHETDYPNECIIIGLIVHESKRNQGIGNKLLKEAEKEIKEYYKVNNACLYCDLKDTFTSEWYKRHGYKKDKNKFEFNIKYPSIIKLYKEL